MAVKHQRGEAVSSDNTKASDRRGGDRRKKQVPFEGPDRRKGDRRSGLDRRARQRDDTIDPAA